MNTKDFQSNVTSVKLAENLEKQFGVTVNVGDYDREQLEDFRNKLRTKIFQQEGSSKFNDLLTNETYQKNKAMLELLNTRIKEMLGEQMKQLRDKMDQLTEAKKTGGKPEWLEKAEVKAELKAGQKVKPAEKKKVGLKQEDKVKEGFPTVDSARAEHEKAKTTGKFDKKQTSTGSVYTRKASTFTDGGEDSDVKTAKKKAKGVKEGMKHPKDCDCKECMGMYEEKADPKALSKAAKTVKKGALHKQEGIPKDKKIGDTKLKSLAKSGTALEKKRAQFALNIQGKGKKSKADESIFRHNVRFVNESVSFLLQEDEEAKAKTITAAGDIVNDFTGWMQRIGQYQTKAIIELADSIRADFGAAESEAFKQKVSPALTTALETLTQQREILSNAVAELAGEAVPDAPMGMEPEGGMDADMDTDMGGDIDMAAPDNLNPEDEFGASDAAAGGDETAGRGLRESVQQRRARRLAEQHSILSKLAR
jgi:hypothetical protein